MNRYQTLERRGLAVVIDVSLFIPLIFLEVHYIYESSSTFIVGVWTVGYSLLYLAYFLILHWRFGQTLGKWIAGVKVLDLDEKPIRFKHAVLRESFYILFEGIHVVAGVIFVRSGVEAFQDSEFELLKYSLPVSIGWGIGNTIVCFKSKKHRALHDFIAGTVVVRLDMLAENEAGRNLDPPGPEAYAGLGANAD